MTSQRKATLSRRELIASAAAGAAAMSARILDATPQTAPPGAGQRRSDGDLALVNGRFVDGRGVVASALTIKNGRIVNAAQRLGPDAQTIDLGGRTVIPGLFDSHAHYTRGRQPRFEARRIERAFSIAELQEAIARRAASVPPGELITCIGGWNHTRSPRRDGRPERNWMPQHPAMPSTFPAPVEGPAPSRTVPAGHSWPQRASPSTSRPAW